MKTHVAKPKLGATPKKTHHPPLTGGINAISSPAVRRFPSCAYSELTATASDLSRASSGYWRISSSRNSPTVRGLFHSSSITERPRISLAIPKASIRKEVFIACTNRLGAMGSSQLVFENKNNAFGLGTALPVGFFLSLSPAIPRL